MLTGEITQPSSGRAKLAMAYLALFSLGLYDGLLGVAWPSIRDTFGVPLDALGVILFSGMLGFVLSSAASGRLAAHLGIGPFLLIGNLLRALGALGEALSPTWWGLILAAFLAGAGAGGVDSGFNTYVATNHSPSRMNWLHAGYGLGAMLGPLLMTGLLQVGLIWRWGFGFASLVQALLTLSFALSLSRWPGKTSSGAAVSSGRTEESRASGLQTLRLAMTWLGIVLFFIYTGIEVTAGQWAYTLFTEARAMGAGQAGVWVSVFWGTFTLGRILLGFAVDRLGPGPILRLSMLGAVLGSALVWWNPVNLVGSLGLALMGAALASIFPAMMAITPHRLGARHVPNAIGFQAAAASLGAAALPGLAGLLATRFGLESIGGFLLLSSIIMLVLHQAFSPRR